MITRIKLPNETVVDYDFETATAVLIFGDPVDPTPYVEAGAYEVIPYPETSKETICNYSTKHLGLFVEACKQIASARVLHVGKRFGTPFTDEALANGIAKELYPHWSLLFGSYVKSHTETMVMLRGEENLPRAEAVDRAILLWEAMTGEKVAKE